MSDLTLKYLFTDRGGREVYAIFDGDDILGEIRLKQGEEVAHIEWGDCDD